MIYFGADVGGQTIKMGLFGEDGKLRNKWAIRTRQEDGSRNIIPDIAKTILEKLPAEGYDRSEIAGVGIAVPGPVDGNGCLEQCPNVKGWKNFYPARELSAALDGISCRVLNDANAAALGEYTFGAGKAYDTMVMLTLGTGVGCGIILDGKMLSGKHGAAAECGHMHVNDAETEACGCGAKGCLEQYCTSRVIPKEVFDAALAGDREAERRIDRAAHYLGIALSDLTLTLDPDVFLFGGGISAAGKYFTDKIFREYDSLLHDTSYRAEIRTAMLGNDAGIYGAMQYARAGAEG